MRHTGHAPDEYENKVSASSLNISDKKKLYMYKLPVDTCTGDPRTTAGGACMTQA